MKSSVHNHYVSCVCGAEYSNPIEKCPACRKPNPELMHTLNSKAPNERPTERALPPPDSSSTLNAKDK